MLAAWKKSFLLIVFSYLSSYLCASEQDSLSARYLKAKDDGLAFMAQIGGHPFDTQLAFLDSAVNQTDDLKKAAYHIQFVKKYLKRHEAVDSLLLLAEQHLLALNCQRGAAEAMFYKGLRAMQSHQTEVVHSALNEAARLFRLTDYPEGVFYSFSRLANYYSKLDNFQLANKYNREVLSLADTIGDVNLKESAYLNVANCYSEQGAVNEAVIYYNLLEKSLEQSHNSKRYKPLYNNLGVLYIHQENWEKANEYLLKSLAIKEQEGDSLGMFGSYQNLFRISLKTQQLKNATSYYSKMNALKPRLTIPIDQLLTFKYNSTIYHILTDNKTNAVDDFKQYTSIKDSINNAVFANELLSIEEGYEIDKRNQTIELLQQKEALQNTQVANLKTIIGIVVAFLVVLLVNGFYMKRQWVKLNEADKRLQEKQDEVIMANKRLETLNKSKDRILSVIGHDLRGPVGGLKELVELYMELPELEPQDITNLLKTARESSSGAYYLLENLLTWANSQRGEIEFKAMLTPVYPVIRKSIDLLNQSINTKNIGFEINIHPTLSIPVDVNMFRTIVRNLVSNAIKHSHKNGLVEVNAEARDGEVLFSVVDHGQGMTADMISQLFAKKEAYYISSDESANGTGLGLILCKEFVERHGGRIWVDSEKEVGTRVCFTLPMTTTMAYSIEKTRASMIG
ncbi:tetratricopeptide repeat-containing sensor histidine kinase [Carboxylicivirga taeanensis]|uniref:tetratricopeptide repeat-containing sensor histidine kinase n=1 Tax=Carboxylicivirga taeanensis TaxID=1416875 RepID=UPI003F6DDAF3